MIIESYNQLTKFILDRNLTPGQAKRLLAIGLKVWFVKDYETTKELIEALNSYWAKYSANPERPLFVDAGY